MLVNFDEIIDSITSRGQIKNLTKDGAKKFNKRNLQRTLLG